MFDFIFWMRLFGWAMVIGLVGLSFYRGILVANKLRKAKGLPVDSDFFEGNNLYWATGIVIMFAFLATGFVGMIAAGYRGRFGVEIPWSIGASWLLCAFMTYALLRTIRRLEEYQPPLGGAGDITQGLP